MIDWSCLSRMRALALRSTAEEAVMFRTHTEPPSQCASSVAPLETRSSSSRRKANSGFCNECPDTYEAAEVS